MSTTQQRTAIVRLMRHAGAAMSAKDRHDWVAVADARTSADDARIALRALEEK